MLLFFFCIYMYIVILIMRPECDNFINEVYIAVFFSTV